MKTLPKSLSVAEIAALVGGKASGETSGMIEGVAEVSSLTVTVAVASDFSFGGAFPRVGSPVTPAS